MTKVICDNCKLEIDVPEGYNAPYIQCPDCASIQKYIRTVEGEPRFKILDSKSRERANNKVIGQTPTISQTQSQNQPQARQKTNDFGFYWRRWSPKSI